MTQREREKCRRDMFWFYVTGFATGFAVAYLSGWIAKI